MTGAEELAIALAGPAVAAIGVVYTIVQTRRKASSDQLAALERKVDCKAAAAAVEHIGVQVGLVEDRVIKLEEALDHMPDRETVHRLELSLQKMEGNLEVLAERMKPVAATSQRLQEYLFQDGREHR